MDYRPSVEDVRALMDDFAQDFGVALPFEDAERILVLYEELSALFAQYTEGEIPPYMFFER